jgi:hypothetical protein
LLVLQSVVVSHLPVLFVFFAFTVAEAEGVMQQQSRLNHHHRTHQ